MRTLFKNAKIITSEGVRQGCVIVEDNKISKVTYGEIAEKADNIIDVSGNLLMAGFVNAHAHTPSTVLRGICDDKELHEWLQTIIAKEKMLTDEDIYWSTLLGIAEYVRGGIVAVEECFGHLEPVVKAYKTSGLNARVSICYPNFKETKVLDFEKQLNIVKNAGLMPCANAHSPYGVEDWQFDEINTFAKKHKLPVSTHMSETLKEVGDCTAENNDLTPPELLESYGYFDRQATVYHAVHCDKDDLDVLKNYEVNVVTCPASNLKLASGIAPVYAMLNKEINVAIGTDGAYSNNSYDMFKEMYLVATLNKAVLYNAKAVSSKEVLDMATINGFKALGMNNAGEIKEGKQANIVLINISEPHWKPATDLLANLVYSGKASDVYFTMVNGKILYENGKYNIGEEIDKIYAENEKIRKRIEK